MTARFFRFDGEPGQYATVSGLWQLLDGRDGCRLQEHRFTFTEIPPTPGYTGFVRALSAGLGRLSDDIAGAIAVADPHCR